MCSDRTGFAMNIILQCVIKMLIFKFYGENKHMHVTSNTLKLRACMYKNFIAEHRNLNEF